MLRLVSARADLLLRHARVVDDERVRLERAPPREPFALVRSPGADVGGVSQVPVQMWGQRSAPVPVQMWQR